MISEKFLLTKPTKQWSGDTIWQWAAPTQEANNEPTRVHNNFVLNTISKDTISNKLMTRQTKLKYSLQKLTN